MGIFHLQDATPDAIAMLRRPDAVRAERGAGVQRHHNIDGLAAVPAAAEERRKPPYCGEEIDHVSSLTGSTVLVLNGITLMLALALALTLTRSQPLGT